MVREGLELAVALARLENRNTRLEVENAQLRCAVDDMNAVCEAAWKEMDDLSKRPIR